VHRHAVISARDARRHDTVSDQRQERTERDVLERSPVPTGARSCVGELNVTAEAPYAAASGKRVAARVSTHTSTSHRLACTPRRLVFVPDVFASGAVAE